MESVQSARISIRDGIIMLTGDAMWTGSLRLYLVNIAGFERSVSDESTLSAPASPHTISMLPELISFLKLKGIDIHVEDEIEAIITARRASGTTLRDAISA